MAFAPHTPRMLGPLGLHATSAALFRRPRRGRLVPAALLGITAVTGAVSGVQPSLGVAMALALIFLLIALWDLALGVCGFVLLAPLDVISSNQDLSLTKAAGGVLVLAWIAAVATQ